MAADLRGHDHSAGLRQAYSLGDFADHLAWLCYELGVYRPVAIGDRTGGLISVELATRCLDLLAAAVTLDAPIAMDGPALARCSTSVLFIDSATPTAGVDTPPELCAHVVVQRV